MKAPGRDTHLQTSVLRTRRGFQHKYRSLGQKGGQGAAVQAAPQGQDPTLGALGWPGLHPGCSAAPPLTCHTKSQPPHPFQHPLGWVGGKEKGEEAPRLTHARAVGQHRVPLLQVPVGWEDGVTSGVGVWVGVPVPPRGAVHYSRAGDPRQAAPLLPFCKGTATVTPPVSPCLSKGRRVGTPPNSPVMFWDGFWGRCPASWAPTSPGEGDEGGLQAPLQPAVAVDEVCHVLRLGQRGCLDG